jgi:hypothetical protein
LEVVNITPIAMWQIVSQDVPGLIESLRKVLGEKF